MGASGEFKSRLRGTWRKCKLGQAQFNDWLKETTAKLTPTSAAKPGRSNSKHKPMNVNSQGSSKLDTSKTPVKDPGVLCPPSQNEDIAPRPAEDAVEPSRIIPRLPTNFVEDVRQLRQRSATLIRSAAAKTKDSKLFSSRDKKLVNDFLGHILEKLESSKGRTDVDASRNVRSSRPESYPSEKQAQPQPPSPAGSHASAKQQRQATFPTSDLGSLFSRSRWNISGVSEPSEDEDQQGSRARGKRSKIEEQFSFYAEGKKSEHDDADDAESHITKPSTMNWRSHKSTMSTSSNWSIAKQKTMDRLYSYPLSRLSASPYFSSGSWRGGYLALD